MSDSDSTSSSFVNVSPMAEETRCDIRTAATKLQDTVLTMVGLAESEAKAIKDAAENQVKELKETAEKEAKELKDAAEKEAKDLKDAAEEVVETTRAEKESWEAEKLRVATAHTFEPIVELNVGGTLIATSLKKLTSFPDSTLGQMFSGRHDLPKDKNGAYFIDRDPRPFLVGLNFLRSPTKYNTVAIMDKELKMLVEIEADLFGLKEEMLLSQPFVPAAPEAVIYGCTGAFVMQDLDKLWRLRCLELDLGGAKIRVCMNCGCGYADNEEHTVLENFTTNRVIDDAQPKCHWLKRCSHCGKF